VQKFFVLQEPIPHALDPAIANILMPAPGFQGRQPSENLSFLIVEPIVAVVCIIAVETTVVDECFAHCFWGVNDKRGIGGTRLTMFSRAGERRGCLCCAVLYEAGVKRAEHKGSVTRVAAV